MAFWKRKKFFLTRYESNFRVKLSSGSKKYGRRRKSIFSISMKYSSAPYEAKIHHLFIILSIIRLLCSKVLLSNFLSTISTKIEAPTSTTLTTLTSSLPSSFHRRSKKSQSTGGYLSISVKGQN